MDARGVPGVPGGRFSWLPSGGVPGVGWTTWAILYVTPITPEYVLRADEGLLCDRWCFSKKGNRIDRGGWPMAYWIWGSGNESPFNNILFGKALKSPLKMTISLLSNTVRVSFFQNDSRWSWILRRPSIFLPEWFPLIVNSASTGHLSSWMFPADRKFGLDRASFSQNDSCWS